MADRDSKDQTSQQGSGQAGSGRSGLANAGESGDPAVQALLADLQTARSNGNEADEKAALKRLSDLGYQG